MRTLFAVACIGLCLTACGSGSNPVAFRALSASTVRADSLGAHPKRLTFALAGLIESPKTVTITDTAGIGSSFHVIVQDPTQVGVAAPVVKSATMATATFYPISRGTTSGSTAVKIVDGSGTAATIRVTQAPCGRPDNLMHADLIYPRIGERGVSPSLGVMFFAVYTMAAPRDGRVFLHVIVGTHGTLEGGSLVKAPPPPGAVIPTPPSGHFVTTYMRASVPKLPAKTKIGTQLYDDNCQPPVLGGGIQTS